MSLAYLHRSTAGSAEAGDEDVRTLAFNVLFGSDSEHASALEALVERGKQDVVPGLIIAARYRGDTEQLMQAMSKLAGQPLTSWREAMLWQEAHPAVVPHPSYVPLKLEIFSRIDPQFLTFFQGKSTDRERMKIRFEEITWGGVPVDGIPSLDNPRLVEAGDASYLKDDDLVFGVSINGDLRAYPLRIMGWHEMFNEVIGGVPVALAYCTLCGAGILFETHVKGRPTPFVFGSSGFLYRSNKLMFDRGTRSLWNQFTGEPVVGPLVNAGIKLKIRPVTITSWANWRAANPGTKVLSIETGHRRDYGSGVVYRDYFASPDLMFPTIVRDESVVKRKGYVFGIRDVGAAKAWPIQVFGTGKVINDRVGGRQIVLIGNAQTRTVRAYSRAGHTFRFIGKMTEIDGPGGRWKVTEDALIGPNGESLPRVAGHISYWFAWDGYLGVQSELYKDG